MELNSVEAFLAIYNTRSFSNAATTLHLSQPAISRRIQLLEQELDALLFERHRSGVRLTAAGEAFLPHAQRVMAAIQDAKSAVQELKQEVQGSVYLALVGTLASTDLTRRLQAFREAHPKVNLRLQTARSAEISNLVRQAEVQLGLRYFADPRPDLISQPLWHERQVVVCSAQREVHSAADLARTAWATYPAGSSGEPFAQVLEQFLFKIGLNSAEKLTIDSLTAQKRLIEADFAVGLLPISSVQEELQLGTLKVIDFQGYEAAVPIFALYRRDGFLNRAAQTLLKLFVASNHTPQAPTHI